MGSIKSDLERRREELSHAISSAMGVSRDAEGRGDVVKDPYGNASVVHDHEIAAAVVDRRARQLEEVHRALEEVRAGRYGTCRDCGEPIPRARLKVMPFATRCVACQARHEAGSLGRAA